MNTSSNSHVRWLLIFWMFLISAIAYLDRVNISIAAPEIASEFHLTDQQLGGIFSSFVLGYALFQTPGGSLADRIGARKILGLGVIWWAIFTTLIVLVSPQTGGLIAVLIAIRFALGMGEAVVYPASNCIVANWIPSTERGIANGIIFAGVGFGSGLTPPLIVFLKINYGWRSGFIASAILGLIAGAIWYVIARDKPSQHPRVSASELALIEQGLPREQTGSVKGAKLPWSTILRDLNIWAITFSYFSYGYVAYIFFTWFFKYLTTVRKMDLSHSTSYTMMPLLAMAVGSPLGGWVSDRLTKRWGKRVGRCYLASAAIGFCAILLALAMEVSNAQLASVVLAGGAGALYVSQSSFWSISADIGKNSAGSVSGFMNMGGQLGGALTASLTPWIGNKYGWPASFLFAALLCAAGALAWLPVKPETAAKPAPVTV